MPIIPSFVVSSSQFLDVFLGKTGQRFAVVEFQLLQQSQTGVFRLFKPSQHGPHGGHFDRVRCNVFAVHLFAVVVLFVDLNLVGQPVT